MISPLLVASHLVTLTLVLGQTTTQPHIVVILADDMGWNDVSFHGSDQVPTPNIDALAFNGIILQNHYVQPICTPSRTALMTGKYPIRTGMQGGAITIEEPRGLPEGKLLPEYLKDLGYVTRAVGKWHLGFHQVNMTPTFRGFDSHLGYWGGYVGYTDLAAQPGGDSDDHGIDIRRDLTTAWDLPGQYATDVFTEEAERLIADHDTTSPLFLYLAHLACHAGNAATLLQAPQEVVNRFSYITDPNRRIYAAVTAMLDESVGRVVAALEQRGMLNNSIILFSADNGAPTSGSTFPNWGSNYPLRGLKGTLWEGGVRGASLLWSPLLQNTPRVSEQLLHISDWLPTLYSAGGGDASSLPSDLDGLDAWEALVTAADSPRTELLYNVNELTGYSAVRVGDWKLVVGPSSNTSDDDYQGASGSEDPLYTPAYDPQQVLDSAAGQAVARVLGTAPDAEEILALRAAVTVTCPDRPAAPTCQPATNEDFCVFNLAEDPCESGSVDDAALLEVLQGRLAALSDPLVPQPDVEDQPELADPARWNHTWSPWTDCVEDPTLSYCNAV